MDVLPNRPEVIYSGATTRAIVINLPAGERLSEHQVHEHTWLVLTAGQLEIVDSHDGTITAGPGHVMHWDPNQRHEVRAIGDSRILMLLTPWPGEGHPSERARANPEAICGS
jgi:quercetin dioxygenase-like cupin family protein